MKKLISIFLLCAIFTCSLSLSVFAYKIGDVVGYALTTDIAATINGYDIPSYNVEGYTYIVVEDLRYYGFSVNYDNPSRSLSVTRDFSQMYASKVYQKPYVSPTKIGNKEHKILYTNIVTYLDGNYIHSYNINGKTIIRFDNLSAYGSVFYDNKLREISATIPSFATNPSPVDRKKIRAKAVIGEYAHTQYDNHVDILKYDGKNIEFGIVSIGQNGNRIASARIKDTVEDGTCYFKFKDSWGNTGNGTLRILEDGKLSLSFRNEKSVGLWSVTSARGTFYRTGDLSNTYSYLY